MSERRAGRASKRRFLAGLGGLAAGWIAPGARAEEAGAAAASSRRVPLLAGRSAVEIALPSASFVSIGVLGPREALLGAAFSGGELGRSIRALSPIDEDGLLPRVVSLRTDAEPAALAAIVDVVDPVELVVAAVSEAEDTEPEPKALRDGRAAPRPLVGFPVPRSAKDGYALAVPARYLFARIDVVKTLLGAFARTQKRFKSDPIFVGDASQWDGRRPKEDLGVPRHISHDGGRDVDLGIPANDTFPSTLRDHCRGVRLETDRYGCAPGTGKGVDVERLAFLLGTLVDEGPAELTKVYIDDVYRREVVRVAPKLFEKKLIKEAALTSLGEDGLMVASPWHTDHIHVRFGGEKGRTPFG
jgi:hypothetical protein